MNDVTDFVLFLGRFHPLLVHFPIGFLFFALILELGSKWKKNKNLSAVIPLALFCGAISAFLASVLGYMLSQSGDYQEEMLNTHLWLGIATTCVSFICWAIRTEKLKVAQSTSAKSNTTILILVVLLVSITGHYGGNLTHGSNYLTKYAPFFKEKKVALSPIEKLEDAVVFDYLVQPILHNKCVSCHNSSKKKGNLSLEDSVAIKKGGENGKIIEAGKALTSELIHRTTLAPNHEDFMPPEGKTPLTEEEKQIITYWIDSLNADFTIKINPSKSPKNVLASMASMLHFEGFEKEGETKLPKVEKIDEAILSNLTTKGFKIRELIFESHLYEIVLPDNTITENNQGQLPTMLNELVKIKENILWLSLNNNRVTDENLTPIAQFQNLQKLVLNNNPITDNGISQITNLNSLSSISLHHTSISKSSFDSFEKLKKLKKIYAWNTLVTAEDLKNLKPGLQIILGSPSIVSKTK
ncbi:hypothetical protein MWU65_01005 [Cellulophaga sp. F20128]|uniref:DUF2231 domain-containing protein n=1 Tax=Cellulophaga sp. F20128 TaxID=2926413 RepID=UPI001FF11CAB|nr:DUF2231 domain-containing protein [Cellulophaga sp. F20128]MCK0155738.1 hypothetical protein [Cellulophaga sp. F20128]